MKRIGLSFLVVASLIFALSWNAPRANAKRDVGFKAPAYNGTANATAPELGAIILDTSSSTFYGNTAMPGASPSWTAFGGAGGSPASWSGYHDHNCDFTNTNSIFNDFTYSACTFTPRNNMNFGTVVSADNGTAGDYIPGIVFTPPTIGNYYVCAQFTFTNGTTNSENYFQLVDLSSTVVASRFQYAQVANSQQEVSLCGIYNVSSVTSITLKIQGATSATTQSIDTIGSMTSVIEWSIFRID